MQIAEASFTIERARIERGCDVEQVDIEFADPRTAMMFIYFVGDEEPLMLLVDLPTLTSEATFDRDALKQALLGSAPAPSVH
jgi:hypothetical protein